MENRATNVTMSETVLCSGDDAWWPSFSFFFLFLSLFFFFFFFSFFFLFLFFFFSFFLFSSSSYSSSSSSSSFSSSPSHTQIKRAASSRITRERGRFRQGLVYLRLEIHSLPPNLQVQFHFSSYKLYTEGEYSIKFGFCHFAKDSFRRQWEDKSYLLRNDEPMGQLIHGWIERPSHTDTVRR